MSDKLQSSEYFEWINLLKYKIHSVRNKVALTINTHVTEFKGFSRRNLYAMKQLYEFYSQKYSIVPQGVAQIPWGHNRLIISKVKDIVKAEFYCIETIKNSWDRDTLEIQIESNLFERKGIAINNFSDTLPANQAEMTSQTLKDPYNFDFLGLENDALEKAIEDELVKNITAFLLELGKGFAFMGRQYKIEIGETDYFIDLLFYHVELRCYIVIELKAGKFKPEFAGKLNFYLSALDEYVKKEHENPSIGIILCKDKKDTVVEFAFRNVNKAMGVATYEKSEKLPEKYRNILPDAKTLKDIL